MFRLITAALLLLVPDLAFGQTLKLPAEIVASGVAVVVTPEYDKTLKLVDVKWVVLGIKTPPTFSYLEPPFVSRSKAGILVVPPPDDDEVTAICVALYEGGKLAQPAVTVIKSKPGTGTTGTVPTTPTTNPTTPTVPQGDRDIPASATGYQAILVVDPANVPADIAALATGSNAITQALGQRGGKWYVRNSTDTLVAPYKPSFEGKQLPVLLVIDSKTNPRKVVDAKTLVPAGDAASTARRIITQIANAVGP